MLPVGKNSQQVRCWQRLCVEEPGISVDMSCDIREHRVGERRYKKGTGDSPVQFHFLLSPCLPVLAAQCC